MLGVVRVQPLCVCSNIDRRHIVLEKRKLVKSHRSMGNVLCMKLNTVQDNVVSETDSQDYDYKESIESIKQLHMIAVKLEKLKNEIDKYEDENYINNLLMLRNHTLNAHKDDLEV